MSTWTVEQSGDQLTLDDTKTIGQHRAAIRRAAVAHDEGRSAGVTVQPIGACWQIDGDGFRLVAVGTVADALRIASLGDWREIPPAD